MKNAPAVQRPPLKEQIAQHLAELIAADKQATAERRETRSQAGETALAELLAHYTLLVQPNHAAAAVLEHDAGLNGRAYLKCYALPVLTEQYANQPIIRTIEGPEGPREIRISPVAAWRAHPLRKTTRLIGFFPDLAHAPEGALNLFQGYPDFPEGEGSCQPLLDHLRHIICRDDEEAYATVLDYVAHALQRPWEKPNIVIVIRGREGDGKSFAVWHLGRLFGGHYLPVASASRITGQYNAHLQNVILLHGDEVFFAGDARADGLLKAIIADHYLNIEVKYRDVIAIANYLRIIATTNAEHPMIVMPGARRPVVLHASSERNRDFAYFKHIEDELERGGYAKLKSLLMAREVNITTRLRATVNTAELTVQKIETLTHRDPVMAVMQKALVEGRLQGREPEHGNIIKKPWPSTAGFERAWHQAKKTGTAPPRETLALVIERDWLADIVYAHCQRHKVHDVPSVDSIGRRLHEVFKVSTFKPHGEQRRWVLPPLETARAQFETWLGATGVVWETAGEEEMAPKPNPGPEPRRAKRRKRRRGTVRP